jgi:chromosome segregation ATPase
MSAQPLVLANNKTPASVASDFLSVIKDIEICIENSNSQASAIENRGLFKSAFSSSRKDLVDISRSQNKINEMMLGLIQEVITLNAMSYSFLAAVIGELEQSCRNGWKDSDGQFQQLSDTGRQFADRANDIFVKILDGSKSTQSKIEVNQQNIAELRDKLQLKAEMVLKHTAEIDSIKSTLSNKAMQMQKSQQDISSIQSLLEVKAERLSHLDEALELQENNQMDMARELVIQDMRVQLQTLEQRTRQLKAFTIGLSVTCLALTSLTALSLFKLF